MILPNFTVLALCAALLHVNAAPAPLRLLVISSTIEEPSINGLRFGHAVPPLPVPPSVALGAEGAPLPVAGVQPKRFRHRPGCVKGHLHNAKLKSIEVSNYFRKIFGWPLIEVEHHGHHGHHHHDGGKGGLTNYGTAYSSVGEPYHRNHFHKHGNSFMSRLQYSLINLGLWEGRAVAFVIGCGIGVLLRMFWVLAIVGYRSLRSSRNGDEYLSISTMEEYDSDDETVAPIPSAKVEPPKYVYIVDEKVATEGN